MKASDSQQWRTASPSSEAYRDLARAVASLPVLSSLIVDDFPLDFLAYPIATKSFRELEVTLHSNTPGPRTYLGDLPFFRAANSLSFTDLSYKSPLPASSSSDPFPKLEHLSLRLTTHVETYLSIFSTAPLSLLNIKSDRLEDLETLQALPALLDAWSETLEALEIVGEYSRRIVVQEHEKDAFEAAMEVLHDWCWSGGRSVHLQCLDIRTREEDQQEEQWERGTCGCCCICCDNDGWPRM
ncbi:hypothetical protein JCM11251_007450 [Rhodosporidiobolus azoricus]